MKRRLARASRRDRIVTGLRKPVQHIRLVELAQMRNWDEVFRLIDKGKAGVNDFIPYVRRVGCHPSLYLAALPIQLHSYHRSSCI